MSTNDKAAGTVTTNPFSTMCILILAISAVVGSGSYFSSKHKAPEPTSAREVGLFEMVFQSR